MGLGTALAVTFAALSFVGGALRAKGQFEEAEETARVEFAQAEEVAEVEAFNAGVAREEAVSRKARSQLNVIRFKKEAQSFVSEQEALFAKAGVQLSGSPLDVMQETIENAETDILIEEFNADIEAEALESEAQERERRARAAVRIGGERAEAELRVGRARAGTTLLTSTVELGTKFFPLSTKASDNG